ncbi:MAG TPA: peptidoglycan DD-metalloendopeptidase family protein, partial [Actinomycetota bacterium]|nr:peptidoglycan DD-metalloendopeptidase family protein [Actinomycetota bacterium]
MKARMDAIQAELDATTQDVEDLHAQEERLETEIERIKARVDALEKQEDKLRVVVAARADELYRAGPTSGLFEVLIESKSIAELSDRAEILSQVSADDATAFIQMARTQAELEALGEEMIEKTASLEDAEKRLQEEADRLQAQFDSVAAEYARLQRQLAAVQPASAPAAAPAVSAPSTSSIPSTNGKACPVGQPHSFIDSWGYPRSGGRSHEGVDMMASYGTPVYAIVSGSITYAGYGDSAGYWQILSGSDGNAYWYMHNQ